MQGDAFSLHLSILSAQAQRGMNAVAFITLTNLKAGLPTEQSVAV